MFNLARTYVRHYTGRFVKDESAQDGFEYLLAIAVIMVAVVTAIALGGPGAVGTIWTKVTTTVSSHIV